MILKFNELRTENDQYVMKSCLVNTDKIILILSGKLTKPGPQLIGVERERELRMMILEGGTQIFVDESVEEIEARISHIR